MSFATTDHTTLNADMTYDDEDDISFLGLVDSYIKNNGLNMTVDFTVPFVKLSLRYIYPLFILLFVCVGTVGTVGNVAMFTVIVKTNMFHDPMFFFLGNMALADIIKALVVLPITLANLLIENWIFGSFLCYFLPMIHDFPIHASMLTYMLIGIDRYRLVLYPMKTRVPAGLCAIAIWVVSVCVVLPYAVYIHYLDLEAKLGKSFDGVGICAMSSERDIEQYIRAMFICLYCIPLAVIAFLYVRVSVELNSGVNAESSVEISVNEGTTRSEVTYETQMSSDIDNKDKQNKRKHTGLHNSDRMSPLSDFEIDQMVSGVEVNIEKEKTAQKYVISMVTMFALCWLPIKILTLVTHFIVEDQGNESHYDITYLIFTFFGYLSTCINPILFAVWQMSDGTKDRLWGYFRFTNRKQGPVDSNHRSV